MSEQEIVKIIEVVGSELCISSDDGEKVYKQLYDAISNSRKVELSFTGVEDLTSAFLNVAIGQLYGAFSEEQIRTYFSVSNLAKEDFRLFKRVIDGAKEYFKNPALYDDAVAHALESDL